MAKEKTKKEKPVKEKPAKAEKPAKEKKEVKKEKPVKAKEAKKEVKELPKASDMDVANAFETISFVLMTEKSVRVVEAQNKLVFIARRNAARDEIKKAVETAFGSPVDKVATLIDQSGRKKAFVKFKNPGAAGDIAIRLGVI